jgi:hypothetical protein
MKALSSKNLNSFITSSSGEDDSKSDKAYRSLLKLIVENFEDEDEKSTLLSFIESVDHSRGDVSESHKPVSL